MLRGRLRSCPRPYDDSLVGRAGKFGPPDPTGGQRGVKLADKLRRAHIWHILELSNRIIRNQLTRRPDA